MGELGQEAFLLYSPLNQGLKHYMTEVMGRQDVVFTLQSIKSRIETRRRSDAISELYRFLLYSPLNQGLKPFSYFILSII